MKKELKLCLIDGIFNANDISEIVLSLIEKKIEFNELNSFRNTVKFNKKDEQLEKRIEALKNARKSFLAFTKENEKASFKIASDIIIQAI